jgi:hypothetical protein
LEVDTAGLLDMDMALVVIGMSIELTAENCAAAKPTMARRPRSIMMVNSQIHIRGSTKPVGNVESKQPKFEHSEVCKRFEYQALKLMASSSFKFESSSSDEAARTEGQFLGYVRRP